MIALLVNRSESSDERHQNKISTWKIPFDNCNRYQTTISIVDDADDTNI